MRRDQYGLSGLQMIGYAVDQYFSNTIDDLDKRTEGRQLSYYDLTRIKCKNAYITCHFTDEGFGHHSMINIFNGFSHSKYMWFVEKWFFQYACFKNDSSKNNITKMEFLILKLLHNYV